MVGICYARLIKAGLAMSFDLLNMDDKILDAYGQVVELVNATPNLVEKAIVDWAEEGLYRGVLYALSDRFV